MYYELHKIGVNINQIARAINTDIDKFINQDFAEDFINLFEEITNDIEKIKGKI
ncbi:plasmid mobilization relaxosome protein MobC [Raoultella planticola]|uniref:plasmid mobilization relaxosome protein MobC n=1 Tax=Raoultella planticola TaxID=575 RepID=UPI003FD7E4A8